MRWFGCSVISRIWLRRYPYPNPNGRAPFTCVCMLGSWMCTSRPVEIHAGRQNVRVYILPPATTPPWVKQTLARTFIFTALTLIYYTHICCAIPYRLTSLVSTQVNDLTARLTLTVSDCVF